MNNLHDIKNNMHPIINLTSEDTEKAIEATKLCESFRVKIINLTEPGPVEIPVRFIGDSYIWALERVAVKRVVHIDTYIKLRELCDLINS